MNSPVVADLMKSFGINQEPWVALVSSRDLRDWNHDKEVAYNQKLRQTLKHEFFMKAVDFLADNRIPGDYFEFGCHRARTFRMMLSESAKKQALADMRYYAFDSFAGLPEASSNPSHPVWSVGALTTSEKDFRCLVESLGLAKDRIHTVPGFYGQSLTKGLQKEFVSKGRPVAMVNVDCDLYESAVPVFRFLEPMLQEGTVLYLDDYFCGYRGNPRRGVALAFEEFREQSRFRFVEHMAIGWWGKSFLAYLP